MAVVTGLTAARMLAIEAASIVNGVVSGNDLILTKFNGVTINAGYVKGPNGSQGVQGPVGPAGTLTMAKNTRTADYTLVIGDINKAVESDLGTPLVFTIPPNIFLGNHVLEIVRYGAGTLTITPGAGVTMPNEIEIAGTISRTISVQMGLARLRFRSTNEVHLTGDIA